MEIIGGLVIVVLVMLGIFFIISCIVGDDHIPTVEAHKFPYVEYKGKYFPVLHTEYNRLYVDDPEQELSNAVEEKIRVGLETERVLGSYVANEDGSAFITHWDK